MNVNDTTLIYIKFGDDGHSTEVQVAGATWASIREHCLRHFRSLLPSDASVGMLAFRRWNRTEKSVGAVLEPYDSVEGGETIYLVRPSATTEAGDGAGSRKRRGSDPVDDRREKGFKTNTGEVFGTSESQQEYAQKFLDFQATEDPALVLNVADCAYGAATKTAFRLRELQNLGMSNETDLQTELVRIVQEGIDKSQKLKNKAKRFPDEWWVRDTHNISTMGTKRPDITVQTTRAEVCRPTDRITIIELKFKGGDLSDPVLLGQPMTYGALLLDAQRWRGFCVTALANEESYRLIRIQRRNNGGYTATYGPRRLYSDDCGFPLQCLVFADPSALGCLPIQPMPAPWTIGDLLGAGATSVAFELRRDNKPVHAIKFIAGDVIENERLFQRLAYDAEAARVAASGGRPRVLEPIVPKGLETWLEVCPFAMVLDRIVLMLPDGALSARHALQAAETLDALHAANIVHRDVRPPNLKVWTDPDSGEVDLIILDFGFACHPSIVPFRGQLTYQSRAILDVLAAEDTEVAVSSADDCESLYKVVVALGLNMVPNLESIRKTRQTVPELATQLKVYWEGHMIIPPPANALAAVDSARQKIVNLLAVGAALSALQGGNAAAAVARGGAAGARGGNAGAAGARGGNAAVHAAAAAARGGGDKTAAAASPAVPPRKTRGKARAQV